MSKILIADYNSKELQRLKQLFEKEGFEVISANDGPSVLAEFEEKKPDVVLLSAMLSKKNGLEVCKKIKMTPDGASVPVIIATSIYKGKNHSMKAKIEYKADEYVEKPISDEALVKLVKKHLKKDFVEEEILVETASKRRHKEEKLESKIDKKISDTDDLDKLISETLSGLGMEIKSKRKKSDTSKKEVKKSDVEIKNDIFKGISEEEEVKDEVREKKVEEKIEAKKEMPVEEKREKVSAEKKVKVDTDAEIDALLRDTLNLALDLDKETVKKEKVEKKKDTGELMLEKLKEEVEKKEEKSEGEKAVEKILSSFDTDIEKKLSDTLHGVGLSDTNIEKTLEPRSDEVEEEEEEGIKFGDYILIEKIGHGGMAELFKAKKRGEEGFQKILAIKRILPHLSDNKELVTMFIDEAKLAAQLSHQNIATIFDFGKIDNSYYIAMEFVDGFDLKKILSKAKKLNIRIPHKLAAYIAEQICSALDYAHHKKDYKGRDLKIVHRDVSPQNILISKEGEVKLVDFGISKAESKIHHTVKGALKGKLLYMSPEQAWGKDVDKRSDVYSMGIVLCEIVSGKVLFEDSSEYDVLEKVRSGKMPILENEINKVPPKLRKIIKKALEIDIEKRYQTAAEMAADLRRYINESKPVPTAKDLRAFLTKLYPEEFGLKPEDVKNLTFDDFMEKFEEGEKLLSEDTVILSGEKVKKKVVEQKQKVEQPKKKVVVKKKVVAKKVEPSAKTPVKTKKVEKKKAVEKAVKKEPVISPEKPRKTTVTKKLRSKEQVKKPEVQVTSPAFGTEEEKESSKSRLFVVAALVIVGIAVVLYLLFGGGGKESKKPVKVAKVNSLSTSETPSSGIGEELPATTTESGSENIGIQSEQTTGKNVGITPSKPSTTGKVTTPPAEKTPVVKQVAKKSFTGKTKTKSVSNTSVSTQKRPVTSSTLKPTEKKPFVPVEKTTTPITSTKTPPSNVEKKVQTIPVEAKNVEKKKVSVVSKPSQKVVPEKKVVTTKPTVKPTKPTVVTKKPQVKPVTSTPVKTTTTIVPTRSKATGKIIKEGDIVPLDSSVNPPKPIKTPKPTYPSKAKILRAHATVITRILINHRGEVEKVRIITVLPPRNRALFSESVKNSLKKWKYKPAEKNGVKVRVWKTVRIKF